MFLMLQQETPDDYVISTGETRTVRDFVSTALRVAGLEDNVEKYVNYDSKLERPAEVDLLVGDSSKAQKVLKWAPKTTFEQLVYLMVENDLRIEGQSR
jgi:GDPmannose 4,6-dehydratase